MAKAYWITMYHAVRDPIALAEYARLSGPAIQTAGGRFIVRGIPSMTYELGTEQRTVLIEFDNTTAAIAAHASPAYQLALQALGDTADRDIRIVESLE